MKPKLESLQVYRGIAAISVVLYHVTTIADMTFGFEFAWGLFFHGLLGVDFFFVLSGFIIFFVHSRDLGHPDRAARYFLKRFFRIYPILFIVLTLKMAYLVTIGAAASTPEFNPDTIISGYLLLLPETGRYFVAVAWTLSFEVLFYAIFLVCILLGKRVAFAVLFTWFSIIVVANIIAPNSLGPVTAFVLNPINLEFLFGCLAGYLFQLGLLANYRWAMLAFGVAGFIIGFDLTTAAGHILVTRLYWATVFFFIILGSINIEQNVKRQYPKFLTILGDASYSIYLFHSSVQAVLVQVILKLDLMAYGHPQLVMLSFGILSVIGGLGFWHLVERPIQSKSRQYIDRENLTA